MSRMIVVIVAGVVGLLSPTPATGQSTPADSARAAVRRAAEAMGGEAALRGLTTVHRELTVEISDPTQGARPIAPGETEPPVYLRDRRVFDTDYAGGRERVTSEGMIYGNQPTSFLRVARADSAFFLNRSLGTGGSGPSRAPIGQLTPEGLLRRALANSDGLTWIGTRPEGRRKVTVVGFKDVGAPFAQRLVFDQESGRLIRLESDNDDPVLGDVLTTFEFLDYRPVGQLSLPRRVVQRRNGVKYQGFVTTTLTVGKPLPDSLFVPPTAYLVDLPPPPTLSAAPIGRDLYLLRAAYNSMFLVADDHVVVIEAPVNSRRSMRVLEEIRRVAPGKPIRYVVATHFHSDHIGGLRPFIAAGATILTTETARFAIEQYLVRGNRTVGPDTLSAAPRAPVIEVVQGRRTLGDRDHPVEVIDLSPNPHADEILAVWFPAERLLFEGDMLDLLVPEGAPSMPGDDTRALAKAITKLGLEVDRIIPVHGRPGTRADLERTLARSDR